MSLLSVNNVSLSFGPRVLLDHASLTLRAGERVALVGPNGAGKSTLLKIISGELPPDDGQILLARGARVGYLPQELQGLPEGPLVQSVLDQVPGRAAIEEELRDTERELPMATLEADQLELSQRMADLGETLGDFDQRFGRHRAEMILMGLGFRIEEMERPTEELSGGWRMRAALAALLLTEPDVLLLDEPTNHLDVPTLAWFDDFLRRSRQAVLLISHDKDFLNRQASRVASFEPEGLREYPGNYDDYRQQRAAERALLEAKASRNAGRRAELEAFIERFRAKASKAKQAQSRVKQLEKLDDVVTLESHKAMSFRFPDVQRSGQDVIVAEDLAHTYGGPPVWSGVDLQVRRGDRIAIVGPNGAGKTTLLKVLANELTASGGDLRIGHNVTLSYYAQHHTERLDPTKTVLEEIQGLVPEMGQSKLRGILGAFLFSGDDVDKPIRVLSGGERARVALARLLVLPANLMLMDEPTNHLDLDSSEALVTALGNYEGTLLFVSHNRSFVNQLASKVWEVDEGEVRSHPGNLDEYLHHKALVTPKTEVPAATKTSARPSAPRGGEGETAKERRKREARERQARSSQEAPVRKAIKALEVKIAEWEAISQQTGQALADPETYADYARSQPLIEQRQAADDALEDLYARWEKQQAALELIVGAAD